MEIAKKKKKNGVSPKQRDAPWRPGRCLTGLTSVHLPFHGLHAPRLLDDVVDELRGFLIPHLVFADPSPGQQLLQVGVQVVGVPAHVRDVPGGQKEESSVGGKRCRRWRRAAELT